ncbi:MAG: terpene cyclase/mutase family protein, partial [Planctomycetota bacterium]|nr:terpene cyclase/mutase family protein [Planctomycetota bacterium]
MSCRMVLVLVAIYPGTMNVAICAEESPSADRVASAIRRSIPLLEKAAAGSAKERQCFTCHSQALPVFALAEARKHGFQIDQEVFHSQLEHTAAHLKRGLKGYLEGRGQGGRVMTAGYALWTLEAGDWKPDEITSAVTHYLLSFQKTDQRWHQAGTRPPSSGSDFANTYLALRALRVFTTEEQQPETVARIEVVRNWLQAAEARDTEDRVFRFRSLPYVDADREQIDAARDELIHDQQKDGGWAQNSDMKSDAYATGSVLVALLRGDTKSTDSVIESGIRYLLDTQLDDGSWHVATRAKAFQPYFETGFPHEKDQFISTSATGWATIALALTLPIQETTPPASGDTPD